jgi:HKD family nuclease
MRSRLLTGTKEMAQVFRKWCERAENIRIVTAWATTDCMACECLEKARSKISTMVVGLDFYTTSPSFLESFLSAIRIGKALRGGTFRPKLYLFEIADRFGCVIGSSNFTRGGFGDNAELNICIEGKKSDAFFRQVDVLGNILDVMIFHRPTSGSRPRVGKTSSVRTWQYWWPPTSSRWKCLRCEV